MIVSANSSVSILKWWYLTNLFNYSRLIGRIEPSFGGVQKCVRKKLPRTGLNMSNDAFFAQGFYFLVNHGWLFIWKLDCFGTLCWKGSFSNLMWQCATVSNTHLSVVMLAQAGINCFSLPAKGAVVCFRHLLCRAFRPHLVMLWTALKRKAPSHQQYSFCVSATQIQQWIAKPQNCYRIY